MVSDVVEGFGLLSALGLGIFALASEWISFLDSGYQATKREMERWASMERHGPQGYSEDWENEILDGFVTGRTLNVVEQAMFDEGSEPEPFQRIYFWPLDIRVARRHWGSLIKPFKKIFENRHREASQIYGPMIIAAMKARKKRYEGKTPDERAEGKEEDDRLESAGLGKWHDQAVMNGHWAQMARAIWWGKTAWTVLIFGASVGTLSAAIALVAIVFRI